MAEQQHIFKDKIRIHSCLAYGYGAGMSALPAAIYAAAADTIEYGRWKTGIRAEGTLYSKGEKLYES